MTDVSATALKANVAYDLALVGAGLANGLIAAAVLHLHPTARIAVIDRRASLAFNQTWCFHDSDVPGEAVWAWLRPLVAHHWQGYDVAFPKFRRGFDGAYWGISGSRFAEQMSYLFRRPNVRLYQGQAVAGVEQGRVELQDGTVIAAQLVLDGRGAVGHETGAGFQKFVGWDVQLDPQARPLPNRPFLMDACVEQRDGYRFVYTLPLGHQRCLLEDTYFSSQPDLSVKTIESRLEAYIATQGWRLRHVFRREQGVLPMPWRQSLAETPFAKPGVIQVGYRGGWYQPATGYSVPVALRVAQALASAELDVASVKARLEPLWRRHNANAGFYRLLNRLAFCGVKDEDRRGVFQRFYRLPEPLVARFYAAESTWWDRARILGGRPPVPLSKFQVTRLMEEVS